jgi:hypothetical protein
MGEIEQGGGGGEEKGRPWIADSVSFIPMASTLDECMFVVTIPTIKS